MALTELTDRAAVLSAMQEYDAVGQAAFLEKYGYAPARRFQLIHNGKSYESKAIAGVAFKYQFPDRGPLHHSEFSGGESSVVRLLEGLGFKVQKSGKQGDPTETTITAEDVQLIRQSRSKSRYGDLSLDERSAYERIHRGLKGLGSAVRNSLKDGGYRLKLTSGFNLKSGVRGLLPKDLWFSVSNECNNAFEGMPQLFMIVSLRGIEYGFAASIHPTDFTSRKIKQRFRAVAPEIFKALPLPGSAEAVALQSGLASGGTWYFRKKTRLEPNVNEFLTLDEWLSFLKSPAGSDWAAGSISRYLSLDDLKNPDLNVMNLMQQMADLFSPIMAGVTPKDRIAIQRLPEVIAFQHPRTLFRKVDYDLEGLLNFVETGFIGLPDIQRPFVWTPTKVRDLFDSMYRGFPVGYLLFWSNQQVRGTRGIGLDKKQHIPSLLVVDGQQRLTSLYAVISGQPVVDNDFRPTRIEIAFRPRDGRFEVTDPAIRNDPEFIPDISALWISGRSSRSLINDFFARLKMRKAVTEEQEEVISHNLDRLFDLKKYPFTALEIDPSVDEESVADIFVRINSEGVKLNQADFILTLLSVFWDEGRAALEAFSRQSREPVSPGGGPSPFNYVIQPGPDRLLRAVVGLGFHRGRLKSVYQVLRGKDVETGRFVEELRERQFSRLKEAQEHVLDLNNWHLFLACLREAGFRADDMISSEIAAVFTYVFYLIGRQQSGIEEHLLQRLIARWFFAASLTARYAVSVESTMDEDLGRVRHATTPETFVSALEDLIRAELTGDFWGITLPAQFETSSSRSPLLTAYHAAQCILRTPVLFSSKVLTDYLDPSVRGPRKPVERHHLFPRDYLKRTGISDRRLVNQVGNLAYVEWPENLAIHATAPADYIPRLRERFDDSTWVRMSRDHALPDHWETLSYPEFLEQRRILMAKVVRRGYETLVGPRPEGVELSDGSAEEQTVWKTIEAIELELRALVRSKYEEKWGTAADRRMREVLGEDAWKTIERNRASYVAKYGDYGKHDPVLDFAYLGQLSQLMMANQAWELFRSPFSDKRQLEDLCKAILPVRNDRAHFRSVPDQELLRCRVAMADLAKALKRLA
jgi:hypothetical protein